MMDKISALKGAIRRAVDYDLVSELRLATEADLDGFVVEHSKCHENVDRWIETHRTHTKVEGWLMTADVAFALHSVVDTGEPVFLDVTPREVSRDALTFIIHRDVSEIPFDDLKRWHRNSLIVPLSIPPGPT